jgi:TonB family protein
MAQTLSGNGVSNIQPLDALVGELFGRAARRPGLVLMGWVLALGSHAAAAVLFANQQSAAPQERVRPPVDVEFLAPPPEPIPEQAAPPEAARAAAPSAARAAPPAAARAGALHTASATATPAQQSEQAVDFTTDPNGASYGGGVVAVGGTAAFGAPSARVTAVAGTAQLAPPRPVAEALTPASDLSRKPQLPGSDPCHGFFPGAARDDEGSVAVMVTIGKSGRVMGTQLLSESPPGQGFGGAARTCLANQHFIPAQDREGKAAATAIRVNLRFSR